MVNKNSKLSMTVLINEYEAMSQKGTVAFVDVTVVFKLVKHYRQAGNTEEALRVISHAFEQFKEVNNIAPELYALKASLLAEIEQEDLALRYLDTALVISPQNIQLLVVKAEILVRLERYEEAEDVISNVKAFGSKRELEFIYLLEAEIAENTDAYGKMFDALRRVLRINPNNEEALSRMWLAMELSERYEDSIDLHTMITDEQPYSYLAWHNLGHAYLGLSNYESAIEAYEFAIVANENFEYAYRDCAAAYLQLRNFQRAHDLYMEVIERFEADTDVLSKLGYCQQKLDMHTSAVVSYKRSLDMQPQNDEAHFRLGECLALQGDFKAAIMAFQKAIKLDKLREEYVFALAQTYSLMGELDLASQAFCKANEIAPEIIEYWLGHAKFYRDHKDHDASLEIIEEAEMNIEAVDLMYSRVICLFNLGRRGEALYFLQEALFENFYLHTMLFDELPHLEVDSDVQRIITNYQV